MSSASITSKPKHVIFRSRGCKTCRARKVKCDEARPVCQRCIRSNIQCQGYSEPTTFLSDNPCGTSTLVVSASMFSSRGTQRHSRTQVTRALPYSPEYTHIAFLERKLGIGTPGDRKGFSWLRIGLESPDKTSLIYTSSRCLADIYYGRLLRRDNVVTSAMMQYGCILKALRQQLGMPGLFNDNSLMSVIMISVVIESVMNQSAAGFNAHLRGLGEVVRRAGPKAFMLRPNVFFFEFCRCFITGKAIVGKYSTFLADVGWKTIPWLYEQKTAIVKLWDIICDLPSIAFNLKCLQDASQTPTTPLCVEALESLKKDIIRMLHTLFDWRWEWEQRYNNDIEDFPTDCVHTSLIDAKGNLLYSTLIAFPNRWRALEIIYYNATLVHLLRICDVLEIRPLLQRTDRVAPPCMAQPLNKSSLKLPSDLTSMEDVLSEFYRSLDGYLCALREKAGDLYQLMFSLSLVSIRMDRNTLEAVWVGRLKVKIVELSGLDLWAAARRRI